MSGPQPEADLTGDRRETKYLVPPDRIEAAGRFLSRHLPPHRYSPGLIESAPERGQPIATVYFDTRSRHLYQEGLRAGSRLRVRAREYADGLPALWLELKHRRGVHSTKRRICLSAELVPWFLARGRISGERVRLYQRREREVDLAVLEELVSLEARYGEAFEACAGVTFERLAWEDPAGGLRVTLDRDLRFHAPSASLWTRPGAGIRDDLGRVHGIEPRAVLEVKTRVGDPGWLADLLARGRAERVEFSKFEEAFRAVHQ